MLEALGVNFAFFEGFDSFAKVNDVLDIAWVEIGHTHFKMLIRVDEVDMVDEFIWLIINPYQPHQLYQPKRKARLRIAQAGFDAFLRWQRKSLLALRNPSFVSAAAHGSVTTTATTHGIFHDKIFSVNE